jgi:hypothetical protein
MVEGIAWLAETFEIGGINIEAGDYGACDCERCRARRASGHGALRGGSPEEAWSQSDLTDLFPRLFETARARRPDAWIYSELQWDNVLDESAMRPLAGLPAGAICQHTINNPYWERVKTELDRSYAKTIPTAINVLRSQGKCQWNGDGRTERYFFNGRDFAEMAWKAHEIGFNGLTVWGEMSSYHTNSELSYLAFARFSWDPTLTWERFVSEECAPLLGGQAAAERYLELTTRFDQAHERDHSELAAMQGETLDAARQLSGEPARRWLWLAERIARRRFDEQHAS